MLLYGIQQDWVSRTLGLHMSQLRRLTEVLQVLGMAEESQTDINGGSGVAP